MKTSYYHFWNQRVKAVFAHNPQTSTRSLSEKINLEWRKEQENILQEEAEVIKKQRKHRHLPLNQAQ